MAGKVIKCELSLCCSNKGGCPRVRVHTDESVSIIDDDGKEIALTKEQTLLMLKDLRYLGFGDPK